MNIESTHTSAYCSDLSVEAREDLIATATQTSVYLLLEYNDAWGAKAIPESKLPQVVKTWLRDCEKSEANTKSLFIRRPQASSDPGIHFFVAAVTETNPSLYHFLLEDYESIIELDIRKILQDDPIYIENRFEDPLFMVCTNGRRDACCSRKGVPVFDVMQKAIGGTTTAQVWQVSHVGGHRFAANLICLPHGLLYGRVDEISVRTILDSYNNGQVYLPNLRGRVCFSKIIQACEFHLRDQSGETGLDVCNLLDWSEISPSIWQARFRSTKNGEIHVVSVRQEKSTSQIYESCALDKLTTITNYILESHRIMAG